MADPERQPAVVYGPEDEARLKILAQLLADVIKRNVDTELKSRRPVKSV